MSGDLLVNAIKNVDLDKVSDIKLVRIIRDNWNKEYPGASYNCMTLMQALAVAKSIKAAYGTGYQQAINFIAEGN